MIPFGLATAPFAERRADPMWFFPGEQYLRALEMMGTVLWSRTPIGVLTAEEGCGKAQLIRRFVADLDPRVLYAVVERQDLSPREFLDDLLGQFGVVLEENDPTDRRRVLARFLGHHLELGRICLVIIRNPQTMPPAVLDEIRALAEIAVDGLRAVKLLLVGQPLLNHVVDSPRMGELLKPSACRFHVAPLSEDQVAAYVAHRLRVAGAADPDQLMPYTLMARIHLFTGGVPSLVNRLCTQALACAAVSGDKAVTVKAVDEAIDSLGLEARGLALPSEVAGTAEGPTPATLVLAIQGLPDRDVPLTRNRILIGRGDLVDIRIDSAFISRYHALIVREATVDLLIDLGSTNGVLVNSRRIMRHVLRHRDLVQVGPARLTYLSPTAQSPAGPDTSQTAYLVRPGLANVAGGGTVLAFGRGDEPRG